MVTYRTGAQFGRIPRAGKPRFSFVFHANSVLRLTDEITGAFRGGAFQRALTAAHHEAAQNIQKAMFKQLQARISPRPKNRNRDSGRLGRAILHERNRFVNASGFKAGVPEWMDQSPAKAYWRQIEEGAPEREAHGFFWFSNAPVGGKYGKRIGPWFPDPRRFQKEGRFYEMRGPRVMLGPFPAYKYGEVGVTFANFQDMKPIYAKHLAGTPFKLQAVLRTTPRTKR